MDRQMLEKLFTQTVLGSSFCEVTYFRVEFVFKNIFEHIQQQQEDQEQEQQLQHCWIR